MSNGPRTGMSRLSGDPSEVRDGQITALKEARLPLTSRPDAFLLDTRPGGSAGARAWRASCRPSGNSAAGLMLAAILFAGAMGGAKATAGQPSMDVLGVWGGSVNAVYIDDAAPDIAYVGAGRRLVILNVGDPENIIELGSVDLEGIVLDVKVRDGYAYVAASRFPNFFCKVNVSNPASPELEWHSLNYTGWARSVDIRGTYAYVRFDDDLRVFNIAANPPAYVNTIVHSITSDVQIVGDLMYVVTNPPIGRMLRIYDLAAAAISPPVMLGECSLPGIETQAQSVCVYGDRAYITTWGQDGVFAVVDVSDPHLPTVRGGDEGFVSPMDVAAHGQYVYLANRAVSDGPAGQGGGLVVYNVSDIDNPIRSETIPTHGLIYGVEVFGDRAYVMDDGEGLLILDVSDPPNPVRRGHWHSPASLRKVVQVGNLLYVSDMWFGISILDVSDPTRPVLLGVYETPQSNGYINLGLAVRDGWAFLGAGPSGPLAVDVSDPSAPQLMGTYVDWPAGYVAEALDLSADGTVLHVGVAPAIDSPCLAGCLFVNFNVSNPLTMNDFVPGFTYAGRKLIEAASDGIVFTNSRIVDSQYPDTPSAVYQFDDYAFVTGIAHQDRGPQRLLFRTDNRAPGSGGGLLIDDAADPQDPFLIGYVPLTQANSVATHGSLAFVSANPGNGHDSIIAYDVSDPAAPVMLTSLSTDARADQMLSNGPTTFITHVIDGATERNAGLLIIGYDSGVPGDLNGDGCTDLTDLSTLLSFFGCTSGCGPSDLDQNGQVSLNDLTLLLSHFGECN
jgi:hypothetical protein